MSLKYQICKEAAIEKRDFPFFCFQAVTTLTAISDSVMLKKNLDAVLRPLSMTEEEVKKELEEKFFNQLTQRHWEHIEVEKYWNTLKQLRTKKKTLTV